jgi:hypothetical protein
MGIVITIVQLLIALIVIAAAMPVVLAKVPAAREPRVGPLLLGAGLVVLFVLIRLVWPRPKA